MLHSQTIAIFGGNDDNRKETSDGITFDVKTRTAKPILGGGNDVHFAYSSLGHQISPEEYLAIGSVKNGGVNMVKLFVSPDLRYFETRLIDKRKIFI